NFPSKPSLEPGAFLTTLAKQVSCLLTGSRPGASAVCDRLVNFVRSQRVSVVTLSSTSARNVSAAWAARGETPLDLARNYGTAKVVQLLEAVAWPHGRSSDSPPLQMLAPRLFGSHRSGTLLSVEYRIEIEEPLQAQASSEGLQLRKDNLEAVQTSHNELQKQKIARQLLEEQLKTLECQLLDSTEKEEIRSLLKDLAAQTSACAKAQEQVQKALKDMEELGAANGAVKVDEGMESTTQVQDMLVELQPSNDAVKALLKTSCDHLHRQRVEREILEAKLRSMECQLSDATKQDELKTLLRNFALYTAVNLKAEAAIQAVLNDLEALKASKDLEVAIASFMGDAKAAAQAEEAPKGATADATNSGPEPKRRERISHGAMRWAAKRLLERRTLWAVASEILRPGSELRGLRSRTGRRSAYRGCRCSAARRRCRGGLFQTSTLEMTAHRYDLKEPHAFAQYLHDLAQSKRPLPRRQEAELCNFEFDGKAESALVSHAEVQNWAAGARTATICSVSHAWETREHPDPCRYQLQLIADRAAWYEAAFETDVWIFYDFTSLFQYERLLSEGQGLTGKVPLTPDKFKERMKRAKFTHRDKDLPIVVELQEKIFDEKVAVCEHLVLKGLPEHEIFALAEALPLYRSLKTLKLDIFECSEEAAEAFGKALATSQIVSLELRNSRPGSGALMGKAVVDASTTNQSLTSVSAEDALEKALRRNRSIKDRLPLDAPVRLKVVADALERNSLGTSVTVDPADDQIDDQKAKAVAQLLKSGSPVESIDLGDTCISDDGVQAYGLMGWARRISDKALAEALRCNQTLEVLCLHGDQITDVGAKALAEALRCNQTLEVLCLHGDQITDVGAK
ncbi:unnamed protein product, partial [Cladocopium goreaui]